MNNVNKKITLVKPKVNRKRALWEQAIVPRIDKIVIGIPYSMIQRLKAFEHGQDIINEGVELYGSVPLSDPWRAKVTGSDLSRYVRKSPTSYRQGTRFLYGAFGYGHENLIKYPFPACDRKGLKNWRAPRYGGMLGWVMVTNRDKEDWTNHSLNIQTLCGILDYYELDYHISNVEIAIDVPHRPLYEFLALRLFPSWLTDPDEQLFNYNKGFYEKGAGRTTESNYFNYRDNRRRQVYNHWKKFIDPYTGEEGELGRIEVRAFRPYLAGARHSGGTGIKTWSDLLTYGPELIEKGRFFTLKEFDLERLHREHRSTRKWDLQGYPVTFQYQRLLKNRSKIGISPEEIRSYLIPVPWPHQFIWSLDPNGVEDFGPHDSILSKDFFNSCRQYPGEFRELWKKIA